MEIAKEARRAQRLTLPDCVRALWEAGMINFSRFENITQPEPESAGAQGKAVKGFAVRLLEPVPKGHDRDEWYVEPVFSIC